MTHHNKRTKAVVFDYGNTLIEFGLAECRMLDAALGRAMESHFGPYEPARLQAIRHRHRMAPYTGDPPTYRENDLRAITREMVEELYGRPPAPGLIEKMLAVRLDAFLAIVSAPGYVPGLLTRLKARYRLALLSNYPDGEAIRASLRRTGLDGFFECVVVSGDLGLCKPHPATFAAVLERLRIGPDAAVYVGDNWLADVQGAKRSGFKMIHTVQWIPPEQFVRNDDDFHPDFVVKHLLEIEPILMAGHLERLA